MKKFLVIFAVLLILISPITVFAQRTTAAATFALTIAVTPANATILVDGVQIKGNVATVTAGNHTVVTKAAGYLDFTTTVSVSAAMTLPVTMQANTFALTIAVTPADAAILVDGAQIKGNVATVTPGNHTVVTKAKGYVDFSTTVSVTAATTLPVTMEMAKVELSVTAANVKGAEVLINGAKSGASPFKTMIDPGNYTVTVQAPGFLAYNETFTLSAAKAINVTLQPATFELAANVSNVKGAEVLINSAVAGTTPFKSQLAPGTYTVTLQAPGFVPYNESFTLTAPKSITVALQPAMGTVAVVLPAANINTALNGDHWKQIQIFVDGALQKGQNVQVSPGKRLIKITSGGLQVEGFFEIQAGVTYTFEPFMGLNLKK